MIALVDESAPLSSHSSLSSFSSLMSLSHPLIGRCHVLIVSLIVAREVSEANEVVSIISNFSNVMVCSFPPYVSPSHC